MYIIHIFPSSSTSNLSLLHNVYSLSPSRFLSYCLCSFLNSTERRYLSLSFFCPPLSYTLYLLVICHVTLLLYFSPPSCISLSLFYSLVFP